MIKKKEIIEASSLEINTQEQKKIKSPRIQTAEGWKRSQLKRHQTQGGKSKS